MTTLPLEIGIFKHQHQPLTVYHLCWLAAAGSTGERRSHLGTEAPGSPRASAAEPGAVPGSPRDHHWTTPSCGVAPAVPFRK